MKKSMTYRQAYQNVHSDPQARDIVKDLEQIKVIDEGLFQEWWKIYQDHLASDTIRSKLLAEINKKHGKTPPARIDVPIPVTQTITQLAKRQYKLDIVRTELTVLNETYEIFGRQGSEVTFGLLRNMVKSVGDMITVKYGLLLTKCFLAAIGFGEKQHTISPIFTLAAMLKTLGYNYKTIHSRERKAVKNVLNDLFVVWMEYRSKHGKNREAWYKGHLFTDMAGIEDREKGIYRVRLIGIPQVYDLIEGKFDGISWHGLERLIADRRLTQRQFLLYTYLSTLAGFTNPKRKAKELLSDVMNVNEHHLQRPGKAEEVLKDSLKQAKKAGFLDSYIIGKGRSPKNVLDWTVTLKPKPVYKLNQLQLDLDKEQPDDLVDLEKTYGHWF